MKYCMVRLVAGALTVSLALSVLSLAGTSKTPQTKTEPASTTWDSANADREYQIALTELKLAESDKPYLIIDLKTMRLTIKLKGAPVWSYPLTPSGNDTEVVREFGEKFFDKGKTPMRELDGKYLFSGSKQKPDSILKIVSEASKVSPELLERIVPARFQLTWSGGLVLDCVTDASGQPQSSLKNTLVELGQMLRIPFGLTRLEAKIDPDAAITLFRAAEPGLPTMINP